MRYNMLSDSQIRTMGMRSVLVTESMTRMDILRELSREPALPVINNSPGHTVGTTFDEERMLIARYTFVKPKHQEELEGDILGRICAFGNLDRDDLDYTMQYRHLDQQAIALLYEASKPRARQQDNPHLLSLDAQLTFLAFSNRKIGQMVVGRRDTLRQADHLRFLSDTSLVSLHRLFIADQTPMAGNNGSIERDLVIRELCQREIMFAELPCSILQEIALSMGTLENVKDVESFEDLVKRASVYIVRYDTSAHLTLTTFHKPNGHGGKWSNYYSANCWDILPAFCSGNNCPDRTRVAAPIGAHVFVQEHAVPHGPAKRLVGIVPMCSKCNQYGENNAPNHQPMGPFKLVTILGERDGKATIAGKANPHKTDKRGNGRKRTTIFFRRSFYLEWGPKKLHMKTKKNSSRWSRSTSEVKGEFSLLRLIIQSLGGSPDESTGQLQREGHIVHKPQLYVCVPLHYRIRGTQDWFQTAEGAIPIVTEVIGTVGN